MKKENFNGIRTYAEIKKMSPSELAKLKKESAKIVAKAKKEGHAYIINIPFYLLNVPSHQRRLDIKRATKIAAVWDDNNCQVITVAYYNDLLWIIDGMHRVNAALIAHIHNPKVVKPITALCSQLFVDKTEKECCLIFVSQNEKTNLKPYDKYKALLLSENKEDKGAIAAQLVYDIVTVKYNINIQDTEEKSCLSAVSAPFTMAQRRKDAAEALDWIFKVLVQSDFYQQDSGMAADIVRGLEDIYDTFKNYHLEIATEVSMEIFENNTYKTLLSKYAQFYQGIDKRTAIKHYFKKIIGERLKKEGIALPATVKEAISLSNSGPQNI